MHLEPQVLESPFLRLEPLAEVHREDLRAACSADPMTWRELYVISMLGDAFDANWDRTQREMADGRTLAFAVMVDGLCQGMSCYLGISEADRTAEIGFTYYHPAVRGGVVNPAAKRLMLGYGFDQGAQRISFRVDAINARSRAAVLKLGAVQEGVLRHDRVTWTGRLRDTVMFSVLANEWPAVRARLDARLAGF